MSSSVSQPVAAPVSITGENAARPWIAPALGAIALLIILGWVFWEFLYKQFRFAIEQQADWGHTLVIPFIAGYFVWLNRQRIIDAGLRTTWFGLLPVMLGVAAYLVCTMGPMTLRHHNLQGAGVALTITGVVLLFAGWRAMRWLLFPLAYLFVFGQTISERLLHIVTFKMQDITARGAGVALSMFLDVDRMGNTLYIWDNGVSKPLNIAQACSGMRMLMAFLALGVAMAYTGLRYPWQRVLLVLLAIPTAIVVNILRVCTLGGLSLIDSDLADGDFHSFIGLVWLMPAFLIFLGLMWIIRNSVVEPAEASRGTSLQPNVRSSVAGDRRAPLTLDRRARSALVIACVTLLVCGVAFRFAVAALDIYLRKDRVELRETFATIPRTIGQWRAVGDDVVFSPAMIEELGTPSYLERRYMRNDKAKDVLHVHLAYYTGMIDTVPHIPDRCFTAAGMEPRSLPQLDPLPVDVSGWTIDNGPRNLATGEPYRVVNHVDWLTGQVKPVRMPMGDLQIRLTEFGRKDQPDWSIYGGFFFVANGRVTARPEDIRMLAFMPSERYAYYCKLQFVHAAPGATREEYLELVSDFLQGFLPEVMLRLPDWQEIERQGVESPHEERAQASAQQSAQAR